MKTMDEVIKQIEAVRAVLDEVKTYQEILLELALPEEETENPLEDKHRETVERIKRRHRA